MLPALLLLRFFGPTGKKRIRVEEFSLFFNKLQNEMAVQAFLGMDPQGERQTDSTHTHRHVCLDSLTHPHT